MSTITLRNQIVATGLVSFNYTDPGWTLSSGSGTRSGTKTVVFGALPSGTTATSSLVSLTHVDASANGGPPASLRIDIGTTNLTSQSFDIVATTWADSSSYGIEATYLILGDVEVESH